MYLMVSIIMADTVVTLSTSVWYSRYLCMLTQQLSTAGTYSSAWMIPMTTRVLGEALSN